MFSFELIVFRGRFGVICVAFFAILATLLKPSRFDTNITRPARQSCSVLVFRLCFRLI